MNKEHKYKDKDEYKDNDKDRDTERITESLNSVLYFRNPEDSSIPSLMVYHHISYPNVRLFFVDLR